MLFRTALALSPSRDRTDTEDQANECGWAKLRDARGGRRKAYDEEESEFMQAWTDALLTL